MIGSVTVEPGAVAGVDAALDVALDEALDIALDVLSDDTEAELDSGWEIEVAEETTEDEIDAVKVLVKEESGAETGADDADKVDVTTSLRELLVWARTTGRMDSKRALIVALSKEATRRQTSRVLLNQRRFAYILVHFSLPPFT